MKGFLLRIVTKLYFLFPERLYLIILYYLKMDKSLHLGVHKALTPNGLFIFDVNTPEKLRALDGQIFLDEDDEVFCL